MVLKVCMYETIETIAPLERGLRNSLSRLEKNKENNARLIICKMVNAINRALAYTYILIFWGTIIKDGSKQFHLS